jgi:hypothetical protein
MNTKINLTYKGVDYVLEYDRASVKLLEAHDFDVTSFLEKPMINIELAFAGSFIKNHKKTNQTTIDEIYKKCPDKKSLLDALIKMIQETYDALLDDPEDNEGNATWEVVDLSPKTIQE